MGSSAVYLNGKEIGKASWSYDGGQAFLWATCSFEERYIYRLNMNAASQGFQVGVMMPSGERFSVKVKLTQDQYKLLAKAKPGEVRGEIFRSLPGERNAVPLPFSFSELKQIDKNYDIKEGTLIKLLGCKDKILYNDFSDKTYIVFKMEMGVELSFSPFFCFITPVFVNEALYGAICLDKSGHPVKIIHSE